MKTATATDPVSDIIEMIRELNVEELKQLKQLLENMFSERVR